MRISQAVYATHLGESLRARLEPHDPYTRVEPLGRGKELPFDGWTARFRCVVEAS